MKMDSGLIQDLYHYSLAMIGECNGLDATTLQQRLDCAESARKSLVSLDDADIAARFDSVIPMTGIWSKEVEMVAAGERLKNKVEEYASICLIDPRTGESVESKTMEAAMQILHGGLFDGTGKLPTAESIAAVIEDRLMPSRLMAALEHLIEAFDTIAERQGDAGLTLKEARCYNEAKQVLKLNLPVS